MKQIIFTIIFSIIFTTSAFGGTMYSLSKKKDMRITGKIIDEDSGFGIPNVSITTPTSVTISRFDGHFKIDFQERGTFQLSFEKKGYVTKQMNIFPKASGMGLNIKLKQKMGTLYGIIRGCTYDGKKHHYDDMSKLEIFVKGIAKSGQKVMLTVTPEKNGRFVVFNLPIGKYKVIANGEEKEIKVKKTGESITISFVTRWCMRKEFHTNKEEEKYFSDDKYLKGTNK